MTPRFDIIMLNLPKRVCSAFRFLVVAVGSSSAVGSDIISSETCALRRSFWGSHFHIRNKWFIQYIWRKRSAGLYGRTNRLPFILRIHFSITHISLSTCFIWMSCSGACKPIDNERNLMIELTHRLCLCDCDNNAILFPQKFSVECRPLCAKCVCVRFGYVIRVIKTKRQPNVILFVTHDIAVHVLWF